MEEHKPFAPSQDMAKSLMTMAVLPAVAIALIIGVSQMTVDPVDRKATVDSVDTVDKAYNNLTNSASDSPEAQKHRLTAKKFVENEEYEKAIAEYSESLKINQYSVDALAERAACYSKLGEDDLAEQDRKQVESLLHSSTAN